MEMPLTEVPARVHHLVDRGTLSDAQGRSIVSAVRSIFGPHDSTVDLTDEGVDNALRAFRDRQDASPHPLSEASVRTYTSAWRRAAPLLAKTAGDTLPVPSPRPPRRRSSNAVSAAAFDRLRDLGQQVYFMSSEVLLGGHRLRFDLIDPRKGRLYEVVDGPIRVPQVLRLLGMNTLVRDEGLELVVVAMRHPQTSAVKTIVDHGIELIVLDDLEQYWQDDEEQFAHDPPRWTVNQKDTALTVDDLRQQAQIAEHRGDPVV